MIFDDYRKGATLAADLVNTVGSISGNDFLPDRSALRAFLDEHEMRARQVTDQDLHRVRELRESLRPIFQVGTKARVKLLNALLREIPAIPQVLGASGSDTRLALVPARRSVADEVAVVAVVGLASVISELGSDRVGLCEAHDCDDVYADTSKNGSRRFCSQSCGTRTHVAAYRARTQGSD
jgi:predicted RNA-binding Zn ribbon-like protein